MVKNWPSFSWAVASAKIISPVFASLKSLKVIFAQSSVGVAEVAS